MSGIDNAVVVQATPERAADIARIHVASRAKGYQGIVPPPALDSDPDVEARTAQWAEWLQETKVKILYSGDQPVGFVAYGPLRTRLPGDRGPIPRFAGEIYALYVHPDYWRKGAGRALLMAGFDGLRNNGFPSALLWVLAKNDPAIALYLSQGGEKCGKRVIDMNGFPVKEVAIGFRNVSIR